MTSCGEVRREGQRKARCSERAAICHAAATRPLAYAVSLGYLAAAMRGKYTTGFRSTHLGAVRHEELPALFAQPGRLLPSSVQRDHRRVHQKFVAAHIKSSGDSKS